MVCCSSCAHGGSCHGEKKKRYQPYRRPIVEAPSLPIPVESGFGASPFGGALAPANVRPDQIADWVQPEHRGPCAVVLTMSYPGWEKDHNGYILVKEPRLQTQRTGIFSKTAPTNRLATVRVGVWRHLNRCNQMEYLVGFRATGIGAQGAFQDLSDDLVLAGIKAAPNPCDINIVQEGRIIIDILMKERNIPPQQIVLAGYSLGGSAALCLAARIPGVRAISFFGGAPPTLPFTSGPGPDRATHYHVVGDLVSSHMDPRAAKVIRVDKGFQDFSLVAPHLSGRFLRFDHTDSSPKLITASDEDARFVMWATGVKDVPKNPDNQLLWNAIKKIGWYLLQMTGLAELSSPGELWNEFKTQMSGAVACNSPIPGSQRQIEGGCAEDTPGGAICRGYGFRIWCRPGVVGAQEDDDEEEEED